MRSSLTDRGLHLRPSSIPYLTAAAAITVAILLFAGLRPASADHAPECDEIVNLGIGEECWLHPDTDIETLLIVAPGTYRFEVWGGGAGGGAGSDDMVNDEAEPEFFIGAGGGGGGSGGYASIDAYATVETEIDVAIGEGGAPGEDGEETRVDIQAPSGGFPGWATGGGGAPGGDATEPDDDNAEGGDGGLGGNASSSSGSFGFNLDTIAGELGTGGNSDSGGDGGDAPAADGGAGGAGAGTDDDGEEGVHPGGGGGGGGPGALGGEGFGDGGAGGDGALRVTFLEAAPDPRITKEGEFDAEAGTVVFTYTIANEFPLGVPTVLYDVITLDGIDGSLIGDVTFFAECGEIEILINEEDRLDAELLLSCWVPGGEVDSPGELYVIVTVEGLLQNCVEDAVVTNEAELFALQPALITALIEDDIPETIEDFLEMTLVAADDATASVTVPPNPDLCPIIDKTGEQVGTHADWTWTITIDATGEDVVDGQIQFTDPFLLEDGVEVTEDAGCDIVGDTIACEVEQGDLLEIELVKESGGPLCSPRSEYNSITAATYAFLIGEDEFGEPQDYTEWAELPTDIESRITGMPSLCDPVGTPTPTPTPTATPEPDDEVLGCPDPETAVAT